MSVVASLDLGSNTLRLLVARVERGRTGKLSFTALGRDMSTPRLGWGLAPGGKLASSSKEAARKGAADFVRRARSLGAETVALAATQACRLAADGAEFVQSLKTELNLDKAVVLSGEQEAGLSGLGVLSRLKGDSEGALLADVGGGSTELGFLERGGGQKVSLAMGSVVLAEKYLCSDPPGPADLAALEDDISSVLAVLPAEYAAAQRLVASDGTSATCAAMKLGLSEYHPDLIDNLEITAGELADQFAGLTSLSLAQRRGTIGLEPGRADIIPAGIAILRGLLNQLNLKGLTVMDAGLLEGILLEAAGESI